MNPLRRLRRLRHQRLQRVLAVAALASAVALPVVLLSVGGGVSDHELSDLEQSGYQIVVEAAGAHGISGAHALASRILGIPDVAAACPILSLPIDAFPAGHGASPALAEGVVPAAFTATQGPATDGLFPSPLPLGDPTDRLHYANGSFAGPASLDVLVSTPFATTYHVKVGDPLLLGPTADLHAAISYNVTGFFGVPPSLLNPTAVFGVLLPLSDLQTLTGYGRTSSGGLVDAADTLQVALAGSAATDLGAIRAVASAISAIVPYYGVTLLTDEVSSLRGSESVLTGFYLALSSVSLAVGLLFLTVVLVRLVETDRRWIGVERAIGVPSWQIGREMAERALALAGGGAAGGVLGGILIVRLLQSYSTPLVREAAGFAVFDPTTLLDLVLAVVALSLLASLAATRAALRIRVVEALR